MFTWNKNIIIKYSVGCFIFLIGRTKDFQEL